jgi:hypothetical protein
MKKLLILTILFLNLISCKKIEKLSEFSLELESELQIAADQSINVPIHLAVNEIILDDEYFENNDTSKDLLEEAKLKKVILSLDAPQGSNFNFLTDIDFYIEANGLPKIRVAWKNDLTNDDKTQIFLRILSENMVDYLKKDKIFISADIINDEQIDRNLQIGVNLSFQISGKALEK